MYLSTHPAILSPILYNLLRSLCDRCTDCPHLIFYWNCLDGIFSWKIIYGYSSVGELNENENTLKGGGFSVVTIAFQRNTLNSTTILLDYL